MLLTTFFIWLSLANIAGFFVCFIDKHKARKRKWRIPEKTIFSVAVFGGSIGVYSALLLFRHKTRHLRFMVGIPIILFMQAFVTAYLILKGYL